MVCRFYGAVHRRIPHDGHHAMHKADPELQKRAGAGRPGCVALTPQEILICLASRHAVNSIFIARTKKLKLATLKCIKSEGIVITQELPLLIRFLARKTTSRKTLPLLNRRSPAAPTAASAAGDTHDQQTQRLLPGNRAASRRQRTNGKQQRSCSGRDVMAQKEMIPKETRKEG